MNNQKKKQEKKNPVAGAVIAAVLILLSIFDSIDDGAAAVIVFIIFIAVLVAVIAAASKKKNGAASNKKVERKAETYTKPHAEVKTTMQERKYYDSDCQNMSSDHDHNRRLEQLDGFLKDGIISHEEYNILKAKYMR